MLLCPDKLISNTTRPFAVEAMTNNGEFGLTENLIDRATNEMELPMKLAESSLFIKYVDQLTKNAHGSVVKSLLVDRFGS
jgi:hypothetical protein